MDILLSILGLAGFIALTAGTGGMIILPSTHHSPRTTSHEYGHTAEHARPRGLHCADRGSLAVRRDRVRHHRSRKIVYCPARQGQERPPGPPDPEGPRRAL